MLAGLVVFLCGQNPVLAVKVSPDADAAPSLTLDPDLSRFITQKQILAADLTQKNGLVVPGWYWRFFTAAQDGDWTTTTNYFYTIEKYCRHDHAMPMRIFWPVNDAFGAFAAFQGAPQPELLQKYGRDIMSSIPAGSVYFGGTDAGRFVVSALSQSHSTGKPFFTLTQNALSDFTYLEYLRDMYGDRLLIPKAEDSREAFHEYLRDLQHRQDNQQSKSDEAATTHNGRITVTGTASVMAVSGLVLESILARNPGREFYLEESYPLERLYSNCLPHGLIFKLDREPLAHLPREIIRTDHQFWTDYSKGLIGSVLREKTSVKELCRYAERVYFRTELSEEDVNPAYVADPTMPLYFSRCRSAIAALYQWRAGTGKHQDAELLREADYAHRQAVALCPYNPEVVSRYVEFLLTEKHTNDAKLLVEETLKLEPDKRLEMTESRTNYLGKLQKRAKELK